MYARVQTLDHFIATTLILSTRYRENKQKKLKKWGERNKCKGACLETEWKVRNVQGSKNFQMLLSLTTNNHTLSL